MSVASETDATEVTETEETEVPETKVPEKDVQVKCCDGVLITIKPQVGKYLKTIRELWEMPNPIIDTHFSSRLMADLNDAVACEDLEALITPRLYKAADYYQYCREPGKENELRELKESRTIIRYNYSYTMTQPLTSNTTLPLGGTYTMSYPGTSNTLPLSGTYMVS
jgi:hypothetical protein